MEKSHIAQSFLSGSSYSLLSNLYRTLLNFAVIIIFARFLTPYDYAVAALSISIISVYRIFSEFSFSDYIIQNRNLAEDDLSSFFWVNIFISAIGCLLFFSSSNFFSSFFDMPEVSGAINVLVLSLLIESIGFQGRTQLVKSLSFKAISFIDAISATIGIGLSFIIVLMGYEYWGLIGVFGIKLLFSHLIFFFYANWKPVFRFNLRVISESFDYCVPLVFSNVLMTATVAIKNGLINNFVGKNELGIFSKADKISSIPQMVIVGPLNRLVFPLLTKFRVDTVGYNENYLYLAKLVSFLSYPLATIIICFPSEFIILLLGENWIEAIPVFKGLSLACFAFCASNLSKWLFLSFGNTHRLLNVNILKLLIFSIVILVSSRYGIIVVAYSYALTELALTLPIIFYANIGTGIKFHKILQSQISAITLSIISVIVPFGIWKTSASENLYIFLLIAPLLYFIIYLTLTLRLNFIKEFLDSTSIFEKSSFGRK